jgi:predicted AAA+ superfamily ATPase
METVFNNLSKYNFWNNNNISFGYLRKDYLSKITKYLSNKLVKVLIGQRRTGKSYILRQIINYLISEKNVNPKNIFYLNKEYIGFDLIKNSSQLDELFKFYKQKLDVSGKIYIFLDEIQNIDQWELFVNSYSQDFTSEYEIFITGSNSNLLSGELATYLSGRYVEFSIYPFSYTEYIDIYNLEKNKTSYLQYLNTGGLPELINFHEQEISKNYIESLKNTIILRDIISRYSIKDLQLLESIFRFILSNIGNLTSVSNIVKYFKSLSKKTNYETVSTYLSYLIESFIIHEVERYDIRGKQTLTGVKKYYINDLSFKNFLLGFTPSDFGYNLENQIYMQLLEKNYKIFTGIIKENEIDFIAQKNNETIYIQVAYLLANESTINREFGNLHKIDDNYPKFVVTLDDVQFSGYEGIKHFRPWELDFL